MNALLLSALLAGATLAPLFGDSSRTLEMVAEASQPRNIQVLLEKDAAEVLLEVKGPYYIFNPHDGTRIESGLLGKRFMIRELETGLKWGAEFPAIHQIYIQPRSKDTAIFINGIQYPGSIAVYGISGAINVVNDIDIESYVAALLAPQFTAPLEQEALAALAIITRTDAYYHASRSEESFWHVAASDVGYQGNALVAADSAVEQAVESTKHLILVHPVDGKSVPFAAGWTEHSAGKTASYQAFFRKEGLAPTKGADAPHAALARQETKWSYTMTKKAFEGVLDVAAIQSIDLFVDQSSGKTYGARIKSTSGSEDFDFLSLQNAVGKNHLLSSDFTVSMKDDMITFTGHGKGTGVGLCLYSANALAQNGENAVKILSKFFPETYLYNLNAAPTAK